MIRKHMGFGHIASKHADSINAFYEQHFNPYLNFHRPSGVPELKEDKKGKIRRTYQWYATPWEILRRLPGLAGHLKDGITEELAAALNGAFWSRPLRKSSQVIEKMERETRIELATFSLGSCMTFENKEQMRPRRCILTTANH